MFCLIKCVFRVKLSCLIDCISLVMSFILWYREVSVCFYYID